MTGARRRWLYAAVCLLALVALVLTWNTIRSERGRETADPAPSTTSLADGALTPSNALGAPVPETEPQARTDGSPIAPWWQRVPPVEGDLIPINRMAGGHVRIDRVDNGLQVTIDHLEVATVGKVVENVRIDLSAGAIIGDRRGFWTERGEPWELASVPATDGSVSVTVSPTADMPVEVRSLILFDADSGELLGGAALIPTD